MKNPGRILLIAEAPNRHTPALQRAFELAKRRRVPVHILLPAYDALVDRSGTLVHPEVRRLAQQQFIAERQAWLLGVAQHWATEGLRVTTEALWAPRPHDAIVARVLHLEPGLVVKDVGHAPEQRHLSFSALDWKLLRLCPAPLLLVHGQSHHLPRRILAAVDAGPAAEGTVLNRALLRHATSLAELEDGEAHVAHVFPYMPLQEMPYRSVQHVYEAARSADRGAFQKFAESARIPPERTHWLEGEPASRLVELARANRVDLLVLGSTYRSALARLFLGSTSENLLARAPCDVLLVKPDAFRRDLERHLESYADPVDNAA